MFNLFTLAPIDEAVVRFSLLVAMITILVNVAALSYLRLNHYPLHRNRALLVFGYNLFIVGLLPLGLSFLAGTSTEPSEYGIAHLIRQQIERGGHWTGQQCLIYAGLMAVIALLLIFADAWVCRRARLRTSLVSSS